MADENDTQQGTNRSPDEIQRQISETRTRMEHTFSALETRLSPQRLKDDASRTIRRQTVGRVEDLADNASRSVKGASTDVFETIKRNPLPAALAAIGLGWLIMESRGNNSPRRRYDYADDYNYSGRYGGNYEAYRGERRMDYGNQGMKDRMSDMAGQAQDRVSQAAGQVQDTASQAVSKVQDTASQAASQVQETAGQVADQVQYRASQAANKLEEMMDQNPLVVGVAALALGAAVGLSLPTTQKEQELMGETRDQLMQKAQSVASDTVDKVQQVAAKAGDAAKQAAQDEAQRQNLPTGSNS